MLHPHIAALSCEYCQKYDVDPDTGKAREYETPDGFFPVQRHGKKPNCKECPRVDPKYEKETTITVQNLRCYEMYKRASAVPGFRFPLHLENDRLLQENFALIASVLEDVKESREWRRMNLLLGARRG